MDGFYQKNMSHTSPCTPHITHHPLPYPPPTRHTHTHTKQTPIHDPNLPADDLIACHSNKQASWLVNPPLLLSVSTIVRGEAIATCSPAILCLKVLTLPSGLGTYFHTVSIRIQPRRKKCWFWYSPSLLFSLPLSFKFSVLLPSKMPPLSYIRLRCSILLRVRYKIR